MKLYVNFEFKGRAVSQIENLKEEILLKLQIIPEGKSVPHEKFRQCNFIIPVISVLFR